MVVSTSPRQIITLLRLVTLQAVFLANARQKKNEHHKEDKSQQGPAVICLMNTSARPSAAERLRPLCCSSSLPPPPHPTPASSQALWRTALSLWTDYRQLKVWQHLKLSPHVANDFPSTDITFNASAAVISIRRTGWDKSSQKNKREKRGWVGVGGARSCLWLLIIMLHLATRATVSPTPLLLLNNAWRNTITI